VTCENNERILSAYALNPGGTVVYNSDSSATFRPARPNVAVKVMPACIPK
jgi:hypothetical protein